MEDIDKIISELSDKAKTELTVFAQSTADIINPFIEEALEDAQTELDVLYELGFLDLDSDEDDEEYARAEFSEDVRQYLNEEIGNTQRHALITKVLELRGQYKELDQEAPYAMNEITAITANAGAVAPDIIPDAYEP